MWFTYSSSNDCCNSEIFCKRKHNTCLLIAVRKKMFCPFEKTCEQQLTSNGWSPMIVNLNNTYKRTPIFTSLCTWKIHSNHYVQANLRYCLTQLFWLIAKLITKKQRFLWKAHKWTTAQLCTMTIFFWWKSINEQSKNYWFNLWRTFWKEMFSLLLNRNRWQQT